MTPQSEKKEKINYWGTFLTEGAPSGVFSCRFLRVRCALLRSSFQKAYEEQEAREDGGNEFRHPEGVPHADCAEGEGEKIGDEHDDEIAQKGDDERGHPHAEPFKGAADDDG